MTKATANAENAPTTAAALAAALRGEPAGLATIYDRFARAVHGIALSVVGHDDADDVTQESFMKIQRDIAAVQNPEQLPGWICSVTRSVAVDHRRRRARQPQPAVLAEAPTSGMNDDELAPHMLRRVAELPEAYRETLILRLVEGLSGPEIAHATGRTPGSVRVNLHRGMTMLRERLSKDGWP